MISQTVSISAKNDSFIIKGEKDNKNYKIQLSPSQLEKSFAVLRNPDWIKGSKQRKYIKASLNLDNLTSLSAKQLAGVWALLSPSTLQVSIDKDLRISLHPEIPFYNIQEFVKLCAEPASPQWFKEVPKEM